MEYVKAVLFTFLTGLNDRAIERGYEWSDGSPLLFLNWQPNQPSDDFGMENCAMMGSRDGRWDDVSCANKQGYICKRGLGKVLYVAS